MEIQLTELMTAEAISETTTLQEIEKQSTALITQVKQLKIAGNDDRLLAEDLVQALKKMEDARFADLDDSRKRAYENYQYHKKRLSDAIDPLIEARKILKGKCIMWDDEQERLRREEQRQREAEARKLAEAEALEMAILAEAAGEITEAEAIINAPISTPATIIIPKSVPSASRLTAGREIWFAEIVDFEKLVKAAAEGKESITLLLPNTKELDSMAKNRKQAMKVTGVVARCKKV